MAIDYGFILSKIHAGKFILRGDNYEGIEWLHNSSKPTKEELETAYSNFRETNDYKLEREKEYPKISDQIDEIIKWIDAKIKSGEDMPDELKEIVAACIKVKKRHPKP